MAQGAPYRIALSRVRSGRNLHAGTTEWSGAPAAGLVRPVNDDADGLGDELRRAVSPRYQVGEEIGRGGMAIVFRGWDTVDHRAVAFKVLKRQHAMVLGPSRFLREIRHLSELHHPGIVPLLDSGQSGTLFYFIMPLVEGETLQARLEREPQLPLEVVQRVIAQAAAALDHAHDAGKVHRDIKPSNLFLSGERTLLADFGIAKDVAPTLEESTTSTGLVVGTALYMSPEQAGGGGEPDPRSDVYALGCVAYQMLVGEPPFSGPSAQAVMARHVALPAPPVGLLRPELPAGVDTVIHKALAKSPADRYQSAGEFARALSDPVQLSTATKETEAPARRRKWLRPLVDRVRRRCGTGLVRGPRTCRGGRGRWWRRRPGHDAIRHPLVFAGHQCAVRAASGVAAAGCHGAVGGDQSGRPFPGAGHRIPARHHGLR